MEPKEISTEDEKKEIFLMAVELNKKILNIYLRHGRVIRFKSTPLSESIGSPSLITSISSGTNATPLT